MTEYARPAADVGCSLIAKAAPKPVLAWCAKWNEKAKRHGLVDRIFARSVVRATSTVTRLALGKMQQGLFVINKVEAEDGLGRKGLADCQHSLGDTDSSTLRAATADLLRHCKVRVPFEY